MNRIKSVTFKSLLKNFLQSKAITIVFLVALYVLIFGSYLVYHQIQNLLDANNRIIHTYQVISKSNSLLLSIMDAQRLEQNYINTGSSKYLLNFQNALQSAEINLTELKQLTANHSLQKESIRILEPHVQKIMTLLEEAMSVFKVSGQQASLKAILSPTYQDLIGKIKRIIVNMNNNEFLLLEENNANLVRDARQTDLIVIIVGSLSNLMLLLSFLLLNYQEQKYLQEQININKELAEKNVRIQEANRLKNEFLANMSHELRTPLNAIIGFSELMHDERIGNVNAEQKGFLSNVLISGKELLRLVNDVLDLSKIEADKMTFHPTKINLPSLVTEVARSLQTLADKKKVCLNIFIDETLTIVCLDETRLKQILYNYLSNALKFTPEFGSVEIRVKPETESTLCLEVEDNGIGIKKEDLSKLFIEFQQLDSSKAKKYQGTGLGLALTKHLVEAQGGKINVISAPGKGSIFSAILPYKKVDESTKDVNNESEMNAAGHLNH